jgi:hypothetical protein
MHKQILLLVIGIFCLSFVSGKIVDQYTDLVCDDSICTATIQSIPTYTNCNGKWQNISDVTTVNLVSNELLIDICGDTAKYDVYLETDKGVQPIDETNSEYYLETKKLQNGVAWSINFTDLQQADKLSFELTESTKQVEQVDKVAKIGELSIDWADAEKLGYKIVEQTPELIVYDELPLDTKEETLYFHPTATISGAAYIEDTYISLSSPDTNFYSEPEIQLNSYAGYTMYSILRFNNTLTSIGKILNATLFIYPYSISAGVPTINVYNMSCNVWNQSNITWNHNNSCTPNTQLDAVLLSYGDDVYYGLNITKAFNTSLTPIVMLSTSPSSRSALIYSSNHGTYQPYVTLVYIPSGNLNITAYDSLLGAQITSFNATLNGSSFSTTNGTIITNVSYGNYYQTVVVNATYYIGATYNHSMVDALTASLYPLIYNITLIDERTGNNFNVSNLTGARVYDDEHNTYQNFKTTNASSINYSISATNLRIWLQYPDGVIINRYIELILTNTTNLRVCANTDDVVHYEILMTSNSEKAAILKNMYANCYVAADYTRFAYEYQKMLPAFTIPAQYYLYTFDDDGTLVELTGINGGNALTINLDSLQFLEETYNVSMLRNFISVNDLPDAAFNNTFLIYFRNIYGDNTAGYITISDDDNGTVYYNNSLTNPNNATIYFNYETLGVANNTEFKVMFTLTSTNNTLYPFILFRIGGSTSELTEDELPIGLVIIVSVIFSMVALTLTAASQTFGAFGLAIIIADMVFVGFGPSGTYKTWLLGIYTIMLLFMIVFVIKSKGRTMVTV